MTFKIRSLALVASVPYDTNKSVNFYKYATTDAAATVTTAGYFNDARDKLKVNDVIEVMTAANSTGDRLVVRVTAAPSSGNVTVAVDEPKASS